MFSKLFSNRKVSSGIFIPSGNSFVELTTKIEDNSINGIARHLGYSSEQVHAEFGEENSNVQAVVFEFFTSNIIFVSTPTNVVNLSRKDVAKVAQRLDHSFAYDSIAIEDVFKDGVNNKSLPVDFLARVLDIQESAANGIFYAERIGYYLYFNDGFLTGFDPADGLNQWAKSLRGLNPGYLAQCEREASYFWGSNTKKITNEINVQCEALMDTIDTFSNKFVELHRTEFGTVNFYMLLVCHYDRTITLAEFLEVNHGRYRSTPNSSDGLREYRLGQFQYQFLPEGSLFNLTHVAKHF